MKSGLCSTRHAHCQEMTTKRQIGYRSSRIHFHVRTGWGVKYATTQAREAKWTGPAEEEALSYITFVTVTEVVLLLLLVLSLLFFIPLWLLIRVLRVYVD